jgi:5-methylcytosine-specific restriction endonuclease McrA
MLPDPFGIKPFNVDYADPLGKKKTKTRKAFTTSTKKIEWMKAGGHKAEQYTEKKIFYQTSKCRRCHRRLTWGERSYDFDHKDNNPANSSQKNCYLVCKVCHGKVTSIGKRKIRDPYFGNVIGYKTVKKKVGYKKTRSKPRKKKKKEEIEKSFWVFDTNDKYTL